MSARTPAARRCPARRRYPNLPAATEAAGRTPGRPRPALCWTCGGFHLTTGKGNT